MLPILHRLPVYSQSFPDPTPLFFTEGAKLKEYAQGVGGEVKGVGGEGRCPWSSKAHSHCAVSTCLCPEQGKWGQCVQ